MELKPYKTRKKYTGNINITISMPIDYYIDGVMEVYDDGNGEYYEWDAEYGVNDVMDGQIGNKTVKQDIYMLKRLGYSIDEIVVDNEKEIK